MCWAGEDGVTCWSAAVIPGTLRPRRIVCADA
jgi:hypothetical protein